jgi:hypothetical protein
MTSSASVIADPVEVQTKLNLLYKDDDYRVFRFPPAGYFLWALCNRMGRFDSITIEDFLVRNSSGEFDVGLTALAVFAVPECCTSYYFSEWVCVACCLR